MSLPKAIIFDMDGLMFDTERLSIDAWFYAGEKMNLNVTKELSLKTVGVSWDLTKQIMFGEIGEFDFDLALTLFQEYINNYIEEKGIPVKPGLVKLLAFLDKIKIKKAIATGSLSDAVTFYLQKSGIDNCFDAIVTAEMVEKGKPNPDIFLHTAKLLNVMPQDCFVLEDSINGIKAAHAAGMNPVMIPDLILPTKEIELLLYAKLDSLLDVIDLLK